MLTAATGIGVWFAGAVAVGLWETGTLSPHALAALAAAASTGLTLSLLWLAGQLTALRPWSLPAGAAALVLGAAAFFAASELEGRSGILELLCLRPAGLTALGLCACAAALAGACAVAADGPLLLRTVRAAETSSSFAAIGEYGAAASAWDEDPRHLRRRPPSELAGRPAGRGIGRMRFLLRRRSRLMLTMVLLAGALLLAPISQQLTADGPSSLAGLSAFLLLGLLLHALWKLAGDGFHEVKLLVARRPILGWSPARTAWLFNRDLLVLAAALAAALPAATAVFASVPVSGEVLVAQASLVVVAALTAWQDSVTDHRPQTRQLSLPTPVGDLGGAALLLDAARGWVLALALGAVLWFAASPTAEGGVWLIGAIVGTAVLMCAVQLRRFWVQP